MGKPKKNANDEKGQCKISSFFSNGPKKNQSPLFSTVDSSKVSTSGSSSLSSSKKIASDLVASKDDVIIIDGSPLPSKSKPNQNETDRRDSSCGKRKSATSLEFVNNVRTSLGNKVDGNDPNAGKVGSNNAQTGLQKTREGKNEILDKSYMPDTLNASEVEKLQSGSKKSGLETGNSSNPVGIKVSSFMKHSAIKNPEEIIEKLRQGSQQSKRSSLDPDEEFWKRPEDDIIPDTPDPLAKYAANSGAAKKKRIVGRSFLSSSSFLKVGHQGAVDTVLSTKVKKANKYNKGRNFDEAYKEMLNAKHGDKGVMGDEEAMKTILSTMGIPDISAHPERLFKKASENLPPAEPEIPEKCDPIDSKLLTALDPDIKIAQYKKTEKTSVVEQIGGVKRPSSGGVSPNPKRQQAKSKEQLSQSKLASSRKNDSLKKQLFTTKESSSDFSKQLKSKKVAKTDSWDDTLKLGENDDTLNEILGQMKTPMQDKIERKDSKLKKGKSSPLSPIDMNIQEIAETQLDDGVDPDEALDDILKELQGTLPTNVSYIESDGVLDTSLEHHNMNTSFSSPESKELKGKAVTLENDTNSSKIELKPKANTSPKHKRFEKTISSSAPCSAFGRHTVVAVEKTRDHTKLDVISDPGKETRVVFLEGSWIDSTHVMEGDTINVIGDFNSERSCCITESQNYVIVHPDLLLSGTSVVSAVFCKRKSVLNERFRGYEGQNVHMLYGSIIHSLFQEVLKQKVQSLSAVRDIAKKLVTENRVLHDVYALGLHESAVMEEIEKYLPQIQKFLQDQEKYKNSLVTPVRNKPMITEVADIEENIWSPRYGVKGKVDLSVKVKYKDPQTGWVQKLVPLELKTGKPSFSVEHKGQVMLYTMMMGDRGTEPDEGILFYLKDGSMDAIPASYNNKKALIQLRNEFAHHMQMTLQASAQGNDWNGGLPPPINNPRACAKCPHLLNCTLFNRTLEGANLPEDHTISQLAPSSLHNLSPLHMSYFSHWVRLLHLEIGVTKSHGTSTKDLWCKPAEMRESESQGIADVLLDKKLSQERPNAAGQFLQTFRRDINTGVRPLVETGISSSDQLMVSAMDMPLLALAMGSVVEVTGTNITLTLDRDLQKYEHLANIKYRLDKVDFHSAMSTNFNNLTRLMEENSCSAKLREVVVDKKRPEFDLTMQKGVIEKVKHIFKSLNKPQKTAILKTLMCKDYILIKGYPGTGKTSTIVNLVRILVTLGYSVLLTSYTHSAVDNILLKLKKHKVDFLRLGRLARVHPDIQPYAAEYQTVDAKSVEDLKNLYQSKSVIATTCLGVNHGVFTRRNFDICIIDEASQVLQPACLGPLYSSKRFILVGDPLQLPPVVQSKEARKEGMAESLFARLDDTGATYELNLQYRMNKEIMRLSNELVYNGALKCGTPAVASATLKFPQPENLPQVTSEWLKLVLSDQEGHAVCVLDTSQVINGDSDSKVVNVQEAKIALTIVQYYLKGGIMENDIGIITPFRKQVVFMRDLFNDQGHRGVEVNTVDQYQGRDKNIIIVSLVKSQGQESEILKDMRRLNVALTRAKHKLIIIGAATVLKAFEPIEKLLAVLGSHQIVPVDQL